MEDALNGFRTLVLNADFRPLSYFPLSVCSWQEAIKALLLDRVDVVSEYEQEVRSPSFSVKIPSVISLKRYIPFANNVPSLTRANLFLRDHYECQYCGDEFSSRTLTFDHVMPRSRGGKTEWTNIVAACHDCNADKGDLLPGKEYPYPLNEPFVPTNRYLQKLSVELSAKNCPESWEDYLQLR